MQVCVYYVCLYVCLYVCIVVHVFKAPFGWMEARVRFPAPTVLNVFPTCVIRRGGGCASALAGVPRRRSAPVIGTVIPLNEEGIYGLKKLALYYSFSP